jgi:cytochrome c oxidase subunit 3
MAHAKRHDYHILPPSIWPLMSAAGAFAMLFGAVNWMHGSGPWLFLMGFAAVLYVMYGWWADVVAESHQGDHTPVVRLGLKYGFIMFIMSEVMFFAAWFWAFFKHAIYPMNLYEASTYVPPEIYAVDPFHLPLINTLVLLLSGCAVTWAHHALVHNESRRDVELGLIIGVVLGLLFTGLQAFEYYELIAHYDWTFGGGQVLLDLLPCHRVPRFSRHHWHDLPVHLLPAGALGPFHRRAAYRVRGGGLVLALCRCGLAVPLCSRLHLGAGGCDLLTFREGGSAPRARRSPRSFSARMKGIVERIGVRREVGPFDLGET